jgi:hypothetical protein
MDGRAATATAFSISAAISGKDTVRALAPRWEAETIVVNLTSRV